MIHCNSMLFLNLLGNPLYFVSFIIALLVAITVHEAAHALVAYKLGDPTAKNEGRVSLNPFVHLDPIGTIFLFLAGFGWGKPVPINPNNFDHPKIDELKVALAGPASNFLLMIIILLTIRLLNITGDIQNILLVVAQINIILMIFNLLPIPPLDGGTILQIFLPEESYQSIQRLGIPLLFAFIIFSRMTNFLSNMFYGVTNFFFNIFLR